MNPSLGSCFITQINYFKCPKKIIDFLGKHDNYIITPNILRIPECFFPNILKLMIQLIIFCSEHGSLPHHAKSKSLETLLK